MTNTTDSNEQQGEAYWEFDADGHAPKPTLRECPLCPDGGQPYFTRAVNGTNMLYVGCSRCGLELKAALLMVKPTKEQPSKDIVAIWNTRRASLAAVEGDDGHVKRLRNSLALLKRQRNRATEYVFTISDVESLISRLDRQTLDIPVRVACFIMSAVRKLPVNASRADVLATIDFARAQFDGSVSAAASSSLPAEPPPTDAHRCPHCGRRMVSEFDEDVGFWRECANCDYREQVSSAPAEPEGEQERLTGVTVGSSRHPHFTHADHERMKATLDALPDNPTEEEAEAVLQVCGTSGKEVVNEFIERLLRERSEMQAELERLRTVTPPETPVVAREAWVDEGGHAWEHRVNIECVECPHCCFTFAAIHGDGDGSGYSCPNCEGCPDAAIITRYLGAAQLHCWHCGVLLEEVESKPRCDQCPADCDDETCSAFGCAPNAAATTPPSETAVGREAERRSNHFSNAAIDKGFPAHISRDNKAHYSDGTVLPAAGDDEGEPNVIDALASALEVAINTVECASIDASSGEELPWYTGAKKALALVGRRSDG